MFVVLMLSDLQDVRVAVILPYTTYFYLMQTIYAPAYVYRQ